MIADILRNTIEDDQPEDLSETCPGLNRCQQIKKWYVPAANQSIGDLLTFCPECKEKYNIKDVTVFFTDDSFCDIHRIKSKIDNGWVNLSFWSVNKKICYDTDSTTVYTEPGTNVLLFLDCYGILEGQCFTYQIMDKKGRKLHDSISNVYFKYLAITPPLDFGYGEFSVEISVYNIRARDFSSLNNSYLGKIKFHSSDKIFFADKEQRFLLNNHDDDSPLLVPFNQSINALKSKIKINFCIKKKIDNKKKQITKK